jgi:hypothetical protein
LVTIQSAGKTDSAQHLRGLSIHVVLSPNFSGGAAITTFTVLSSEEAVPMSNVPPRKK